MAYFQTESENIDFMVSTVMRFIGKLNLFQDGEVINELLCFSRDRTCRNFLMAITGSVLTDLYVGFSLHSRVKNYGQEF